MDLFSNRLKLLRISLNLSQQEFGDKIGYSNQQISNYEKGKAAIPDRLITYLKKEYGENFGLPAETGLKPVSTYEQTPEKMIPEDRDGEVRPGSYGIPDLKTTGVSKIIVEISPQEMILLNSIRQLDASTQKGIFITVMGQLNALEQKKHIRQDKQKKDFLKNCIRELSKAVSQAE